MHLLNLLRLTRFFLIAALPLALLTAAAPPPPTGILAASVETFDQLDASSTQITQSGDFIGVAGLGWEYAFVRKVSGKISGASAQLDRNGRGRLATTLSGGLGALQFKLQTVDGGWHTTAQVRVMVNGVSYGVRSPQATDTPTTITISDIDLSGTVTLELSSVGSLEAIVDDVAITSFGSSADPGEETFAQLNAPTGSLGAGSYVGDNGEAWFYERAGTIADGITGRSIVLRKYNGLLQTTLPEPLTSLRFSIRTRDGGGNGSGKVQVVVGGSVLGEYGTQVTGQVETFTINDVNAPAGSPLAFHGIGVDNTVLDNISWQSSSPSPNDLTIDVEGWSVLSTSPDSRLIYCSDSEGSDTNSGLSDSTPVKTLSKAFSLVRNGFPDHVYLKRGDVWVNQTLNGLKRRSGRSGKERLVVSYYGMAGARPQVKTNNVPALNLPEFNNVAIVGLEFYNYTANPQDTGFVDVGQAGDIQQGFRFIGVGVENLLVEDCKFSFYRYAMEFFVFGYVGGDAFKNIDLRRNIFVNSYQRGSTYHERKAQGIFVSDTKDFLLEENFFDHNGWNETFEDALANKFNHNAYFSTSNAGPMTVRGNVFSRAAAHGLQLRSGGDARYNAFIGNAIGMNVGYSMRPEYYLGPTRVEDNVFTDGRPQIPDDREGAQTGAIWGIWRRMIDTTTLTISNNIVANIEDDRGGKMEPYHEMTANQFGSGNVAWDWIVANDPATDPGWRAPSRNKESFVNSLGYDNYDEWVRAAANRPLRSLPNRFTARRYVDYIKEGFTVVNSMVAGNTGWATHVSSAYVGEVEGVTYLIYPNPTSIRSVTVEAKGGRVGSVRLLTVDGRVLRVIEQIGPRVTVDLQDLTPGMYVVEIDDANYPVRKKLIVR